MSPVRVNRCATRKAEAQLQVHAAVPKASSSGQCVARSRVCATQIIVERLHVCAQSSARKPLLTLQTSNQHSRELEN